MENFQLLRVYTNLPGMPAVSPFEITITIDYKCYWLQVSQTYMGRAVERYELTSGDKRLVMETDRLVIDAGAETVLVYPNAGRRGASLT